jgi:hypothetical protein
MAKSRYAPPRQANAPLQSSAHAPAVVCALVLACGIALATVATWPHAAHADAASWNVLVGDAIVDTLDCPLPDALDAGRWVLAHDAWTIEPGDSTAPRMITRWKPVKHPLVRLVAGEARVRVAVAMRPLVGNRTEVTMQGGLATETSLIGSPVYNLARAAGEHECRGYFVEIRQRLDDVRIARADTAGGTVHAAAASHR